jgi:hypothetical protein
VFDVLKGCGLSLFEALFRKKGREDCRAELQHHSCNELNRVSLCAHAAFQASENRVTYLVTLLKIP